MADPRAPARPDPGTEVAAVSTGVGAQLAPYVGEISPDPRQVSSYRQAGRDHLRILRLYRDTLRDEQAHSAFAQRLDAAIAVPWEVQPGGADAADVRAADALREQLRALDFDQVSRQMLHGIWYGYAVAEALWETDGALVRLAGLRVRAPDRFRWERDRELLLRTYQNPWGAPVPPSKFWVLARPGEHGDVPHGPGLARWCYWPVWMRRHGHRFWSVALEKFGSPTPKGHYPPGDEESRRRLLEALRDLATGSGIALPEGQDVDLLTPVRRTGEDFHQFSVYMDQMLAKVILGQSATTEQGPWRGTAEVQKEIRDEVIAADCRLLGESFTSTVAAWLTAWNFPGAATPRVLRDASPPENLDRRAEREERVARTAGARPTLKHVQDVYGGEWEIAPAQAPAPMPGGGGPAAGALASGDGGGDSISRAVESLLADGGWEPLMEPVVGPVLAEAQAALERGDGLEEFRARLPDLLARMDDGELTQALRRMGFSARVSGLAGLADDD